MGGVAGHTKHLYQNPDLTFSQIKDILIKAAAGRLEGTEKIDGINIYLSFSVSEQKAVVARSKTDINNGGLDLAQISQKFATRPGLRGTFVSAITSWENLVKSIAYEKQELIFPSANKNYFNAEIIDKYNPNVIGYDVSRVIVHATGHKAEEDAYLLLADEIRKSVQAEDMRVIINETKCLPELEDDGALTRSLCELHEVQRKYGLNDNDPIGQVEIDSIIHNFSVVTMNRFKSSFIRNSEYEINRLKQELENATRVIQNSGNNKAVEILKKELSRINNANNFISSGEGFVFSYAGATYKLTGNFAPINQVLGLFRYGRGKDIPPLNKVYE